MCENGVQTFFIPQGLFLFLPIMLNIFYVPIGFWIVIGGSILHEGLIGPRGLTNFKKNICVTAEIIFADE